MIDQSVLEQIQKGAVLKKANVFKDASAPVVDKDAHIHKVNRNGHLSAIEGFCASNLKKAEVKDRSRPILEEGVHLRRSSRPELNLCIKDLGGVGRLVSYPLSILF
mmetsp:Transcript_18392/g.46149  ORF Transcript_18392/g.46149 Transcript_18392/m.46149 type:complete len:106 (-) Transcript_18392:2559-2876(-)